MSYEDKVREVISNIDLGKPLYTVNIRRNSIQLDEKQHDFALSDTILVERLVNRFGRRVLDTKEKKYKIDEDKVIESVGDYVTGSIISVFQKCSPYAEPRRTKVYKNFCDALNGNRKHPEFIKAIFDIYEYYHNSTLTDSITTPINDVHRKNVYNLLCLMEKRYGKKTSN